MAGVLEGELVNGIVPGVTVRFAPQVIEIFDKNRQRRWFSKEAGGQLFAKIGDHKWEIVKATGPRPKDQRGRFRFWPDRKSEQAEIDACFESGLDYVGDWHTHPEQTPSPSPQDIVSITNVVRESTIYTPGLLLCIVGLAPFPRGLYVSFHSAS